MSKCICQSKCQGVDLFFDFALALCFSPGVIAGVFSFFLKKIWIGI